MFMRHFYFHWKKNVFFFGSLFFGAEKTRLTLNHARRKWIGFWLRAKLLVNLIHHIVILLSSKRTPNGLMSLINFQVLPLSALSLFLFWLCSSYVNKNACTVYYYIYYSIVFIWLIQSYSYKTRCNCMMCRNWYDIQ